MALFVRRSFLTDFSIVFFLSLLPIGEALAQHPAGRLGGAVPAPSAPIMHPPVYHPPVYQAPVYQPPIYRAPLYPPLTAPHYPTPSVRTFGIVPLRPPGPIRPFLPRYRVYVVPVFTSPFWPFNYCWWATCNQYWTAALIYNSPALGQWNPANYVLAPSSETQVHVYGQERPDVPQLFLKDGTILNVTDYWVVDSQLHFMLIEEDGVKPVEQVIPFDELDLQKTIDANTQRGFRFLLRNAPFEQYVRDHPEGPPPALSPQHP
jgi:hypothetical protein